MGIGNTHRQPPWLGATFGLRADEVVGRAPVWTTIRLKHKTMVIATALSGSASAPMDPFERLCVRGIADIARASASSVPRPAAAYRCSSMGSSRRRSSGG